MFSEIVCCQGCFQERHVDIPDNMKWKKFKDFLNEQGFCKCGRPVASDDIIYRVFPKKQFGKYWQDMDNV